MFGRSLRSGYTLNSQLTKTTAKKPCFSKSGDTAPIPNAHLTIKNLGILLYDHN